MSKNAEICEALFPKIARYIKLKDDTNAFKITPEQLKKENNLKRNIWLN